MEKLRVGVVGLKRGNIHCRNAAVSEKVELVAVCDIDRARADMAAQTYGVRAYYDHRELCAAKDIDAVIMATPIDVHTGTVIDALNAGKHVLSEVIVATSLEGIDQIGEAIRRSGKNYMMAENYCYIRPLLIVEEMIRRGMFGEIYYAESDYLKDFQAYHPLFPNIGGWRQKTYFGRRGHPYITHTIGPLLHIMQEKVTKVSCMASGRAFDMPADSTCTLMLQTERKHLIRLRASFVSPRPDNVTYYSFQGTEGCYQAPQGPTDFHKVYLKGICKPGEWKNVYEFRELVNDEWKKYWDPEKYDARSLDNDTYELYDSGTLMMLDKFAGCTLKGEAAPVSFADAANWTAAGLLSADSVNRGSVPLPVPTY